MLEVKANNGTVEILTIKGSEDRIIGDIGTIAHKVMLLIANQDSTTPEEVYLRYGILARQLVEYIDTTVKRIDEIGK